MKIRPFSKYKHHIHQHSYNYLSPCWHFPTNYIVSSIQMEGFQANTITHCLQRCHQSHSLDIHHSRLLPHIREEYEFRITNRLLIQKITNPRRDRVIMDSLLHASRRNVGKKKTPCLANEKTLLHRRKMIGHRKVKQQDSAVQVDCLGDTEAVSTNRYQAISKLELSKSKHLTDEFQQLNQTFDIAQSKPSQKDSSNFRNNFVGRIIKNGAAKQRNQIIEDSCCARQQTFNSNSHNLQSQLERQAFTLKRIVRNQDRSKLTLDKENKESYDESWVK